VGTRTVLGQIKDAGLRASCGTFVELAVPAAVELKSPRACRFALLGLQEYLDSFPGDRRSKCSRRTCESPVEFLPRRTFDRLELV